jgi:transposase
MRSPMDATAQERIAALESALAAERSALAQERARVAELTRQHDRLRDSHERLRLELELLRRRIFIAKAERVDTAQLELEFAATLAALDHLGGTSPPPALDPSGAAPPPSMPPSTMERKPRKPTGRRDLRQLPLEEERVEISDPLFDELVADGKAERIGFEESCRLAYKRGGMRRLIIARVKYRAVDARGESVIETAPMPPECFPRSLAAPSALAHVISEKFCDGMPFNRVEDRLAREGVSVDRGTMCRWAEDAGATVGATVIAAARAEAWRTAFCIATDATGVGVLPLRRPDGKRQACRRGHFFVLIADRDHIFFEYAAKETSLFVAGMLRGYSGYVQADAKSVYDVLFREPGELVDDAEVDVRKEVGCWSHARRGFWEAACAKSEIGREGLARIGRFFDLEDAWRGSPAEHILSLRRQHLRPHLEAFFAWAEVEYERVRKVRGLVRSALGYVVRQKQALMRVCDDGRLVLENNRSERELRRIAVGRRGWLFVGSDAHGESAGHLFSLIASARLHRLDPEAYLRDLFRVLAHWPRERYLELAPKYWARTRARLDPVQLAAEFGPLTVPPPEQQPATD